MSGKSNGIAPGALASYQPPAVVQAPAVAHEPPRYVLTLGAAPTPAPAPTDNTIATAAAGVALALAVFLGVSVVAFGESTTPLLRPAR